MNWKRKDGSIIKVDDYDLFQNGSWVPGAIRLYLITWFPNLVSEYDQQISQEKQSQPEYSKLVDGAARKLKNPKLSRLELLRRNIRDVLKPTASKMGNV